jgi:hypothetical protein
VNTLGEERTTNFETWYSVSLADDVYLNGSIDGGRWLPQWVCRLWPIARGLMTASQQLMVSWESSDFRSNSSTQMISVLDY